MSETVLNGSTWKVILAAVLSAFLAGLASTTYFLATTVTRTEVRQLIEGERASADRTIQLNRDSVKENSDRLTDLRIVVGQMQIQINDLESEIADLNEKLDSKQP